MIMDPKIRAHLERAGHVDNRGIGRTVQAKFCRTCGRSTLTASDAPMAALTAVADPAPLDVYGELAAVMAGLATYDLRWTGARYELDFRDYWHIQEMPPGGRSDVLAQHLCGRVNVPGSTTRHSAMAAIVTPLDAIPF